MLKSDGYSIFKAYNGEEALAVLQGNRVDLVLLDIVMPGISGYDVARKMKKNADLSKIPIIFFTSQSNESEIVKGFECGGEDYIFKPFREKELLARVRTHIELKVKREQLEEVNQELECIVAEKTEQLKRALTELEKAYDKLDIANKQLCSLNKAKSDFIKIISHEIRTPLNGIIGFSELIKMSSESEELIEYVNILMRSTNRLEEFSEQALLLTEMQMGEYNPNLQRFEILPLIDELLPVFNFSVEEKNLHIEYDINPRQCLFADRQLFRKALYNILENSIRYSDRNGKITISCLADGYTVSEVAVCDKGKGFSQESLDSLFMLFASGCEHIDRNPGLGLATVKMIMDLHMGDVKVLSSAQGATVKLIFPKSLL